MIGKVRQLVIIISFYVRSAPRKGRPIWRRPKSST
jgi:hypothetical protein